MAVCSHAVSAMPFVDPHQQKGHVKGVQKESWDAEARTCKSINDHADKIG
jgi:hypothetical protein